ncbi:hypothetical protein, partial [Streptomyces sp. NPDC060027]|uniref:hypothetical protein n=1 Tax=Streptomyces sp. NPDC060027 TaxID=3347040 RepID=UPI0036CC084E
GVPGRPVSTVDGFAGLGTAGSVCHAADEVAREAAHVPVVTTASAESGVRDGTRRSCGPALPAGTPGRSA